MTSSVHKLEALTSLRFFAAGAIVFYHFSKTICPELQESINDAALYQGVSFFYVLSGFILTYVHARLDSLGEIFKFLRARVARIYPTYIVGLVLTIVLAPPLYSVTDFWQFLTANLLLVQDWIPVRAFCFSFNVPAWSISCEFFFYLCFPLLIADLDRNWFIKLVACVSIVVALISLVPAISLTTQATNPYAMWSDWFTTLSPLTRLLEFTFGMCVSLLYMKRAKFRASPVLEATAWEVILIAAVVLFALAKNSVRAVVAGCHLPEGSEEWLLSSGGAPVYGALIFVMARRAGLICKFLEHGAFVLLGEISYSMYLLHYPLLEFLNTNRAALGTPPPLLIYLGFTVFLFSASYANFSLIEKPMRQLLSGRKLDLRQSPKPALLVSLLTLVALSIGTFFELHETAMRKSHLAAEAAQSMLMQTPSELRHAKFGDCFALEAYGIESGADGVKVKLAWQKLRARRHHFIVGFQLLNSTDSVLASKDYPQDRESTWMPEGAFWIDEISVDSAEWGKTSRIGLFIYDSSTQGEFKALPIDRGPRDWGNKRLLIEFKPLPKRISTNE